VCTDVFLSPMKPREKVVTAEDIQNSLYYIHVEQPEDARLIHPPASLAPPDSDPPPTSSHGPIPRKPVSDLTTTRRKPVPATLAPAHRLEGMQNGAANNSPNSPGLLGPGYVPPPSFQSTRHDDENMPPLPRRPSEQPTSMGTSLTLIRRDPASSAQWNVARIEDPLVPDVSSSMLNDSSTKRKIGAPAYIEITNPGYSKFLHAQPPSPASRDTDIRAFPGTAQPRADGSGGVFRRRLWMEGGKNPSNDFGHKRPKSYDSNVLRVTPRSSLEVVQHDRSSMDARPSAMSLRENPSYNNTQSYETQSAFRGYVFTSPWNGRCEFITGAGGGSLKVCMLLGKLIGHAKVEPVSTYSSRSTRSFARCSACQRTAF
jgi:hypothetical protein